MQRVLLEVESRGCPSCVVTIIPHLLRLKGVKGAKIQGGFIIVLLDDEVDVEYVVKNSAITDYYKIKKFIKLNNHEECINKRIYKLP